MIRERCTRCDRLYTGAVEEPVRLCDDCAAELYGSVFES